MLTVNGSSVNGKQIKLIIDYYYYCNYYNYIIIGALDSTRSQHIRAQFWNEGHCESPHISLLQYIYGRPDNPYCLGFTRRVSFLPPSQLPALHVGQSLTIFVSMA